MVEFIRDRNARVAALRPDEASAPAQINHERPVLDLHRVGAREGQSGGGRKQQSGHLVQPPRLRSPVERMAPASQSSGSVAFSHMLGGASMSGKFASRMLSLTAPSRHQTKSVTCFAIHESARASARPKRR